MGFAIGDPGPDRPCDALEDSHHVDAQVDRTVRPDRQAHPRPSRRVRLVELTGLELLDRRILPAVTATFSAVRRAVEGRWR